MQASYYTERQAEDAMSIMATWMSHNSKLRVVYHGGTAVDADIFNATIRIPRLACASGMTQEALMLLRTRVYHEAGHIDETKLTKNEYPKGVLHEIWNALEDRRMEAVLARKHKGCDMVFRWSAQHHNRKIAEKLTSGHPAKPLWEALVAMSFILEGLQPAWNLSDKARAYVDAAYDEFAKIRLTKNAKGALALAKKIYDILKETHQEYKEQRPQPQPQPQQGEPQEQEDGESSGQESGQAQPPQDFDDEEEQEEQEGKKSSSSGDDEDESEKSDSDSEDKEDEDDSDGSSGSSGDEEDGEEDEDDISSGKSGDDNGDDSEESDDDSDGSSGGEDDGDDSESNGQNTDESGSQEDKNSSKPVKDADNHNDSDDPKYEPKNSEQDDKGDKEEDKQSDEEMEKELQKESDGISKEEIENEELDDYFKDLDPRDSEYLSRRDYDQHIIPPSSDDDRMEYKNRRETVAVMVAAMTRSLEQALRSLARCRKKPYLRQGNIDKQRLVHIAKGLSKEVFCTTRNGMTLDVAVEIIIDESGSMNEWMEVQLLAMAIGEALEAIHIPFEITGTTTTGGRRPPLDGFSRTNPIMYRHYKTFEEQWRTVRQRIIHTSRRNNNIDGEAVEYCAFRLAQRKEKRKIIFSLSDGEPCGGQGNDEALAANITRVCQRARENKIEVYGFGIGTVQPKRYYGSKYFVYLQDPESMGADFVRRFAAIVTGGAVHV